MDISNNDQGLYDLPDSWEWINLGDVCQTTSGGTPSRSNNSYFDGNIPWLKSGELDNKIIHFTEECITEDGLSHSSAKIIQKGTLLIALYGATVGKLGILGIDSAINQAICAIFTPCFLNNQYLFFFLFSQRSNLLNARKGGAQPNINQQVVNDIKVPLPPINEQKRIVEKIEELFTKLDAGIELLRKLQVKLKRYRQSVLKSAFEGKLTEQWRQANQANLEPAEILLKRILQERREKWKAEQVGKKTAKYQEPIQPNISDLPDLPEGWCWVTVGEISTTIHYGYTASALQDSTGVKLLRITDIQDNHVDWQSVPYCEISDNKKQQFLLKEGDLVFARTGATVGKSYLIDKYLPEAVFASYLIRIILRNLIDKKFVYLFFQSNDYWLQINRGKLGIGQPNVNAQILSKIKVPLPPLQEQNKIVEEIDRIFSVTDQLEKIIERNIKRAEKLRQSILKQAFTGKLVPQDINDKPAAKLLEKIKQEKAKSQPKKKTTKRSKGNS